MKERLSPCLKFHSEEVWKIGVVTVQGASSLQGCELVNKQRGTESVHHSGEAEVEPEWGRAKPGGEEVGRGWTPRNEHQAEEV